MVERVTVVEMRGDEGVGKECGGLHIKRGADLAKEANRVIGAARDRGNMFC